MSGEREIPGLDLLKDQETLRVMVVADGDDRALLGLMLSEAMREAGVKVAIEICAEPIHDPRFLDPMAMSLPDVRMKSAAIDPDDKRPGHLKGLGGHITSMRRKKR